VSLRNDEPTRASRPWDNDRDGFVLGEGAGVLVIEERQHALRRGAEPIAELVGYARNSDAYHANAPLETGEGVRSVMERALADAAIPASEIGYLNAHATSTPLGDRAEAAAIRNAFSDHAHTVAVSSTKSMTGHLLGGAGSLEAGFTVLALRDQIAPPTINLECPDIDYGLDFVPRAARPLAMQYAMTNSFGFGGGNTTLIFKTPD
jgi:3-oxoacyl-[acyl-carrier-protein] synthase II